MRPPTLEICGPTTEPSCATLLCNPIAKAAPVAPDIVAVRHDQ
jgi:hypothetical protein